MTVLLLSCSSELAITRRTNPAISDIFQANAQQEMLKRFFTGHDMTRVGIDPNLPFAAAAPSRPREHYENLISSACPAESDCERWDIPKAATNEIKFRQDKPQRRQFDCILLQKSLDAGEIFQPAQADSLGSRSAQSQHETFGIWLNADVGLASRYRWNWPWEHAIEGRMWR
jgi:hypothetical protein